VVKGHTAKLGVEFLQPFAQDAEEVLSPRLVGVECLAETFDRSLGPGLGFLVCEKAILPAHANITPFWLDKAE